MTKKPTTWVISSGRQNSGHLGACLGVGEALGDFEHIAMQDISAAGGMEAYLDERFRDNGVAWPDYVVTFNNRTSSYAVDIKKLSQSKYGDVTHPIYLVQIREPSKQHDQFDLIASLEHEAPILQGNVCNFVGMPHHIKSSAIDENWKRIADRFQKFNNDKETIVVLLGGDVRPVGQGAGDIMLFDEKQAKALGRQLRDIALEQNASLIVTNSQRTSDASFEAFKREIEDVEHYCFDVKQHAEDNIYPGILHIADKIVVASDSISMASEAASVGKPLYLTTLSASHLRDDHKTFARYLVSEGHASLLDDGISNANDRCKPFENPALKIADLAREGYKKALNAMSPPHADGVGDIDAKGTIAGNSRQRG